MKKVIILKLENDGSQKQLAVCTLQADGVVLCEGDAVFIKNLNEGGIVDFAAENTKLFPKDGARFLEQLKHNFKSGYLSVVEED